MNGFQPSEHPPRSPVPGPAHARRPHWSVQVLRIAAAALCVVVLSFCSALLGAHWDAPESATSAGMAGPQALVHSNRDWSASMNTVGSNQAQLSKLLCNLAPEDGNWTAHLYSNALALTRMHLGAGTSEEDARRTHRLLEGDCWSRLGDFSRFIYTPDRTFAGPAARSPESDTGRRPQGDPLLGSANRGDQNTSDARGDGVDPGARNGANRATRVPR